MRKVTKGSWLLLSAITAVASAARVNSSTGTDHFADGIEGPKRPLIQVADGIEGPKRPLIQVADGIEGPKRPLIQVADGIEGPKRPLAA